MWNIISYQAYNVQMHFYISTNLSSLSKLLTAHNWQKWKRVFLTYPCHKIYRVEAVGLKISNKNMWNLGQFCEKSDILLIPSLLKFESKNPFAHVWHASLWSSDAYNISCLLSQFLVNIQICLPNYAVFTVKPPPCTLLHWKLHFFFFFFFFFFVTLKRHG